MQLNRRSKRRIGLLAIVIVLGVGGVVIFRTLRSMQQDRLLTDARTAGLAAYNSGDLQETLENLSYYFQHKKDDVEVNLAFADARARLPLPDGRHLAEARALYESYGLQLLGDGGENTDDGDKRDQILHRLLKLNKQLGIQSETEFTADQILAANPDDEEALTAKAESLYMRRQFGEATPLLHRLIELSPDDLKWRRLLLNVNRQIGTSSDELIELCTKWSTEFQGDGRFHLLTAETLLRQSRFDEAKQELKYVVNRGVTDPDVLHDAVILFDTLGLSDQADALINTATQDQPDLAWVREVAIRRLWLSHRIAEALQEIDSAENEFDELSPELHQLKTLTYIAANDIEQAQSSLSVFRSSLPADHAHEADRAWISALTSMLDANNSNWRATLDVIHKSLAYDPDDAVMHLMLGDINLQLGEEAKALDSYRLAWLVNPHYATAATVYARALYEAGLYIDAFKTAQTAMRRFPHDQLRPFLVFARAYFTLSNLNALNRDELIQIPSESEMIQLLEQAYEQLPDHQEIVELLAEAYLQSGDVKQLNTLIDEIINDDHASPELLLSLANICIDNGVDQADRLLQRAKSDSGLSIPIAFAKARMMAQKGNAASGLELINSALSQADPADPSLLSTMCGRIAFMLDVNHHDAIDSLANLIAAHPKSIEVQQFALNQDEVWQNPDLAMASVNNLKKILGDQSPQVQLAEANLLLRHRSDDPKQLAKAIVAINRIVESDSSQSNSLSALSLAADAALMGAEPDTNRAIEYLTQATERYPTEPLPLIRLISLLQAENDFESAERYLRKLAHYSQRNPSVRSDELWLLSAQGDFQTALTRASTYVDESSPIQDRLMLASLHHNVGNVEKAEVIYQKLIELAPLNPHVILQTADFYASTDRLGLAIELIQSADTLVNTPPKEILIGALCKQHDNYKEAHKWLAEAVVKYPHETAAHIELAQLYFEEKSYERARDAAMAGLNIDPSNVELRTALALAELNLPGTDRTHAMSLLRETGSTNKDLLALLTLIDIVPVQNGKSVPSNDHLAQARQLLIDHSRFLPAWYLAVSLHVEAGQLNEAIDIARRAVTHFPFEVQPAQWATELLIKSGNWNDALVEAHEWRNRLGDQSITADSAIATILLQLNRPKDALAQLNEYSERLVSQVDQHPARFETWIRALALSGQFNRAAEIANPLLKESNRLRALLVELTPKLNNDDALHALNLLDGVITEPGEQLALASLWTSLGRKTGNQSYFDRAATLAVQSAGNEKLATHSLLIQGSIAEASNNSGEAESLYKQVIQTEPKNIVALNNLAYLLTTSLDRCDEALTYIKEGLAHAPNQPDLLDTYAQVLLCLDQSTKAEEMINLARSARPDDFGFQLTLAEIHLHRDQYDEAENVLDAINLDADIQSGLDHQQQERFNRLRERLSQQQTAVGL